MRITDIQFRSYQMHLLRRFEELAATLKSDDIAKATKLLTS